MLDERRLAIADLGGNNRLDTMENIVATGQVGMLVVHPGKSETVRVNGRAWISRDPELLARFPLPRTPVTAIAVEVVGTFIHCAKAFMRSGMWDPETWSAFVDAPDGADILACQKRRGVRGARSCAPIWTTGTPRRWPTSASSD